MPKNPTQRKLEEKELKNALEGLPGWEVKNDKLHKEFRFKDFAEAFGFMASVAVNAEEIGQHPEWFNVYNVVVIDLHGHRAGGICDLDITLAHRVEELIARKS